SIKHRVDDSRLIVGNKRGIRARNVGIVPLVTLHLKYEVVTSLPRMERRHKAIRRQARPSDLIKINGVVIEIAHDCRVVRMGAVLEWESQPRELWIRGKIVVDDTSSDFSRPERRE